MSKPKPIIIDPKTTWVISDTHWGHRNIIDYCCRPEDFEDILVREWNATVPEGETVLHLGDLSYRNNGMFRHVISKKLVEGRRLLIKGNHDHSRSVFYRESGFQMIRPFEIFYDPDPAIAADLSRRWVVSFSHYPLKAPEPYRQDRRHIHIHGHIHNNGYGGYTTPFTPFSLGQINVSVEQTHYKPVNLDHLLKGYIDGCYEPPGSRPRASEAAEAGALDPQTGAYVDLA